MRARELGMVVVSVQVELGTYMARRSSDPEVTCLHDCLFGPETSDSCTFRVHHPYYSPRTRAIILRGSVEIVVYVSKGRRCHSTPPSPVCGVPGMFFHCPIHVCAHGKRKRYSSGTASPASPTYLHANSSWIPNILLVSLYRSSRGKIKHTSRLINSGERKFIITAPLSHSMQSNDG